MRPRRRTSSSRGSAAQAARPRSRKVLFFDDRYYAAQGAQKLLVQLAGFGQEAGLDVAVGSTQDGALLELARSFGLKTVVVGKVDALDRWNGALLGGGLGETLKSGLGLVGQNAKIARFVRSEDYDLVWGAAMRACLSLVGVRVMRRPVVWQIMGSGYFLGFSELVSVLASRIVLIAEGLRPAVGRLARFSAINKRIRFVQTGLPAPASLTDTRTVVMEELGLPPEIREKVWLTSIGAHIAEKGHLDVVEAVAALPAEVRARVFLMVGGPPIEGDYHDRLLRAQESPKFDLRVLDWVANVDEWLRAADIFVLASQREGMPLTVVEAMQRGAVPVGYAVGGVPELIIDEETGLLVECDDTSALSAALGRLVCDPALRRDLAHRAQEFAQQNNSLEAMRVRFTRVIDELMPLHRQESGDVEAR